MFFNRDADCMRSGNRSTVSHSSVFCSNSGLGRCCNDHVGSSLHAHETKMIVQRIVVLRPCNLISCGFTRSIYQPEKHLHPRCL